MVVYGCPVEGHIVSDGYIVPDFYGRFLIKCMQYRTVLYVYTVADTDRIHIAAQYGIEPYAALLSHDYIAYDGGIFSQVAVFSYLRGEPSY